MKENPFLSSETGYIILPSEKSHRDIFIICVICKNIIRRFFKLNRYIIWKDTEGEGKVSLDCCNDFWVWTFISCSSLSTALCLTAIRNISSRIPNDLDIT